MSRVYAAFLRGISPMNARMADLKKSFEAAGFKDVATVLTSGNVVFSARDASESALARRAEKAMNATLGHAFLTIVRAVDDLRALLEADPFTKFRLPAGSKRVVTFLPAAPIEKPKLPVELDGARILTVRGAEVLSAYVPSPRGPAFMTLIERTFGKDATTRSWETVGKVVKKAG